MIRQFILTICIALFTGTASGQTGAYPTKPIRFIIDFPAGGVSDILARTVGERMSEALGQPLVYDNKPGAGGRLPYAMVAKAEPDGYAIGFISTPFILLPNLFKKLAYDTEKDFTPVAMIARYPNVLLVNGQSRIGTVEQFIDYALGKGDALNYGSFGVGSSPHLTMELFRSLANLRGTHVPYAGSPQGMQALMSNQIDVIFGNVPGAFSQIRAGTVKPLAVTGLTRSSALPNVPTLNERGLAFDTVGFAGLVVPSGTPTPIVRRLNEAVAKSITNPEIVKRIQRVGAEPVDPGAPEDFSKFLAKEMKTWAPVIVKAGGPFQD